MYADTFILYILYVDDGVHGDTHLSAGGVEICREVSTVRVAYEHLVHPLTADILGGMIDVRYYGCRGGYPVTSCAVCEDNTTEVIYRGTHGSDILNEAEGMLLI